MADKAPTIQELLHHVAFRKIDVEALLDPNHVSWVKFDPQVGYVPADNHMRDGMDYAVCTYTHGKYGERSIIAHADKPCRINTYGDSFTQCQQVSDNESWQERLAAHIGEPVRNLGCGGHSVYTAYLRAMRTETTEAAADYLIFSPFVDDHIRSLDAARWIRTAWNERDKPADKAFPLHGLPWSHVRYDLDEKKWVEKPGACKTENDLLALTDKETFYETFKDDQIVRLFVTTLGGEAPVEDLEELGNSYLGLDINLRDPERRIQDAQLLHKTYGLKSSEFIYDKLIDWAEKNDRKVMTVLTYCMGTLAQGLNGDGAYDQMFIDYLEKKNLPYVSLLEKHKEDFEGFNSLEKYMAKYFIQAAGAAVFGHYNPMANMFYAMAIKNEIVEWMNPKPPAYQEPGSMVF